MRRISRARRTFLIFNTLFLSLTAFLCLVPFINLLAISLSSAQAAESGQVLFLPVDFTLNAYRFLIEKKEFFSAFWISVQRVLLGTLISTLICMLAAYSLSRRSGELAGHKYYVAFFVTTMFFSGGLVPLYIVVTKVGLYNSIFSLILPTAVNAWNIVLFINFFRQVPRELEESADIDGANHFIILFKVVLPVSLPALATVMLLTAVYHWNAWFDGYIYMASSRYPLQTYIFDIINQIQQLTSSRELTPDQRRLLESLPGITLRSAQIFIAMIPVMLVYRFAQNYFIKGLLMGSIKE